MAAMFGHHEETTYAALIDIGAGSIAVGVVALKGEDTEFLYIDRHETPFPTKDKNEHLALLAQTLRKAFQTLSADGVRAIRETDSDGRITRVLAACAAPWSRTIPRRIHLREEHGLVYNKKTLAEIQSDLAGKIADELKEDDVAKAYGFETIDRIATNVRINGYRADAPSGIQGTELELLHITGLAPKYITTTLTSLRDEFLPEAALNVHPRLLVQYCALEDMLSEEASYCIIDIGGEATEIGIVSEGELRDARYALTGSNVLSRALSSKTALQTYKDGTLTDTESEKVQKILETYQKELAALFIDAADAHPVPRELVISTLPGYAPLLADTVCAAADEATGGKHQERAVQEKGDPDPFLALYARFFHKLHACGELAEN